MELSEIEADTIIDSDERMYAPVEAALILGLKPATVQGMCRDGRIKATKHSTMWRISKSEVKRYIRFGPRGPEERE